MMDPLIIVFTLVTNLTTKLVRFVNGLFEPKEIPIQKEVESISSIKKRKVTEIKEDSISAIKPTKPVKEVDKPTFNKPKNIKPKPSRQYTIEERKNFHSDWIFENKPMTIPKKKTQIALNDEDDLINVFYDGSKYYIE